MFLRVGISIIAHFPIVTANFKAVKRRSKIITSIIPEKFTNKSIMRLNFQFDESATNKIPEAQNRKKTKNALNRMRK